MATINFMLVVYALSVCFYGIYSGPVPSEFETFLKTYFDNENCNFPPTMFLNLASKDANYGICLEEGSNDSDKLCSGIKDLTKMVCNASVPLSALDVFTNMMNPQLIHLTAADLDTKVEQLCNMPVFVRDPKLAETCIETCKGSFFVCDLYSGMIKAVASSFKGMANTVFHQFIHHTMNYFPFPPVGSIDDLHICSSNDNLTKPEQSLCDGLKVLAKLTTIEAVKILKEVDISLNASLPWEPCAGFVAANLTRFPELQSSVFSSLQKKDNCSNLCDGDQLNVCKALYLGLETLKGVTLAGKPDTEPTAAVKEVTAKEPTAAVKEVTAKEPTAAVKEVTTKEPTAAVKEVTTKETTAAVKEVTAKEPTAAVKEVTTKEPTAAVKEVTTKETTAAVKEVTAKEPTAVVKEVTTKEPTAAVKEVTAKEPTAAVKEVTTKETTAAVKEVTAKEPTAAVKEVTTKEPTAAVKEVTTKEPTAVVKEVTAKEPTAAVKEVTTVKDKKIIGGEKTDNENVPVKSATTVEVFYSTSTDASITGAQDNYFIETENNDPSSALKPESHANPPKQEPVNPPKQEVQHQKQYTYDDEDEPKGISFMSYFLVFTVLCVAGYIVFHNKQKIIALVVEGKGGGNGRRQSNKGYKKLNTEDVMSSLESSAKKNTDYVY